MAREVIWQEERTRGPYERTGRGDCSGAGGPSGGSAGQGRGRFAGHCFGITSSSRRSGESDRAPGAYRESDPNATGSGGDETAQAVHARDSGRLNNLHETTRRWILVARILRPRGNKGEVVAELLTDFPSRFSTLKQIYLQKDNEEPRLAELQHFWLDQNHPGMGVFHF